jgi:hypothetical protein
MRTKAKAAFALFAAGVTLYVAGAGLRAHANDDVTSLEGSWRITISAPPSCQGAPPACITASEFSNFYPGLTLTETNTILFAASEPNPPNFSSGSDGYGTWRRTDTPNVYFVRFEKLLFQTQSVPTYVSPTGKLVVNTAVATIRGEYTVNSDGTLSGPFTITITPPNSGTVLFEANGSVKGVRLAE